MELFQFLDNIYFAKWDYKCWDSKGFFGLFSLLVWLYHTFFSLQNISPNLSIRCIKPLRLDPEGWSSCHRFFLFSKGSEELYSQEKQSECLWDALPLDIYEFYWTYLLQL